MLLSCYVEEADADQMTGLVKVSDLDATTQMFFSSAQDIGFWQREGQALLRSRREKFAELFCCWLLMRQYVKAV